MGGSCIFLIFKMAHAIWRTIRRPFRYPSCAEHVWEVYDCNAAGCLKCGAAHFCHANAVDNRCPLVVCDDHSRVCTITGMVLSEVRHGPNEYLDTAVQPVERPGNTLLDVDAEVHSILFRLLQGAQARRYREEENGRQGRKLASALQKSLKQAKMRGATRVCPHHHLAEVMGQERNLRFVSAASERLVEQCSKHIVVALVDLHSKGVRTAGGNRLQGLVCGLLYLLRTGLTYQNLVLLASIEEISGCLPHENKLEAYFGISSKVICETENEIKLVFRGHYQK
jgi:hypothetical protein